MDEAINLPRMEASPPHSTVSLLPITLRMEGCHLLPTMGAAGPQLATQFLRVATVEQQRVVLIRLEANIVAAVAHRARVEGAFDALEAAAMHLLHLLLIPLLILHNLSNAEQASDPSLHQAHKGINGQLGCCGPLLLARISRPQDRLRAVRRLPKEIAFHHLRLRLHITCHRLVLALEETTEVAILHITSTLDPTRRGSWLEAVLPSPLHRLYQQWMLQVLKD